MLSRFEICRITGLHNNLLKFSINKYGKPFLAISPHLHYNISHAGHYVACAFSDEPIGIDIEIITPIDLKIAERFFAPNETTYIMESEETLRFYEVWTKKESRIKFEGKGLHIPLPSFSVLDSTFDNQLMYYNVFQNSESICHVCSAKKTIPVTFQRDYICIRTFTCKTVKT